MKYCSFNETKKVKFPTHLHWSSPLPRPRLTSLPPTDLPLLGCTMNCQPRTRSNLGCASRSYHSTLKYFWMLYSNISLSIYHWPATDPHESLPCWLGNIVSILWIFYWYLIPEVHSSVASILRLLALCSFKVWGWHKHIWSQPAWFWNKKYYSHTHITDGVKLS